MKKVLFPIGRNLNYGFPNHPLTSLRLKKTIEIAKQMKLFERENLIVKEVENFGEDILYLFHTKEHVEFVKQSSKIGKGFLDYGDTPSYKGVFENSLAAVEASLMIAKEILNGNVNKGFNIAGGLHHAYPDRSAGFCVFNDIGVSINYIFKEFKIKRILYVDIDAHHGDGVFYSFYNNPKVWIADIHQLPLYPGTGFEFERGEGEAEGTKLNIPIPPNSSDKELLNAIEKIINFGKEAKPEIIILQAGADGINGDPLTQLKYSLHAHLKAVKAISSLADEICNGKLIVVGGGGYNIENVSKAWANILDFLTSS
ncbi:MAG: acetoin utilization protein AcuC [Candidatus Aenigmatarchaeota archaeon]